MRIESSIHGPAYGLRARRYCPLHSFSCSILIGLSVELKPEWSGRGGADLVNRIAGVAAHHHDGLRGSGGPHRRHLALGMRLLMSGSRGYQDRHLDLAAE